jgi:hypothetical protein
VVALLAIVGSIFAARGGDTNNERRTAEKTTTPAWSTSETRVETSPQGEEQTSQPNTTAATPANNEHSGQVVETAPLAEEQPSYNSNGQAHELATQLQTLHEEAQQLSQRLSVLTKMAEHIEQVMKM